MKIKRFLSLLLIFILIFSFITAVGGAYSIAATDYEDTTEYESQTPTEIADILYDLGLFRGTNYGYELERQPTRAEGITLLIRMLGEEEEALNCTYNNPFNDVPQWADRYVAFAYAKGYTNGTSATTFSSNTYITPEQFITYVLRALGYKDNVDFIWNESIVKAEELGIVETGKYTAGSPEFYRGDCVVIMYNALIATLKSNVKTLAQYLVEKGTLDAGKAETYGVYTPPKTYEMVKVPLKTESDGKRYLYGKDVIAAIKNAKYILMYWNPTEKCGDYETVYDTISYPEMVKLTPESYNYDYYTNNEMCADDILNSWVRNFAFVCTVYDKNANMVASCIQSLDDILSKGYVEFALLFVNGKELYERETSAFNELFGHPVEYKDAIAYLERAHANITFISKNTGEIIDYVPWEENEGSTLYRYVIDSSKYPELAKNTKYLYDNYLTRSDVYFVVWRHYFLLYKYEHITCYKGQFSVDEYTLYSDNWTFSENKWNCDRFVVFSDDTHIIGYTKIVPKNLKIVDVGEIDVIIYRD